MSVCWREQVMSAIFAAVGEKMKATFGDSTKTVREMPDENTGNVTDPVTCFFLELDGTRPTLADNSGRVINEVAPILFLVLLKCGEGETASLPPKAAEFEAAIKSLFGTPIQVGASSTRIMPSDAYGRAVGRNQMWVDVPASVLLKQKP